MRSYVGTASSNFTIFSCTQRSLSEPDIHPPLPPHLSVHFSLLDAAVVLHLRTLAPTAVEASSASLTGFSLRHRLGLAPRLPTHDEVEQLFTWRGEEVRVREKVRVESQDPSLIAVMAKLSALGHGVAVWRASLGVVMGEEER